ncbi:MAG: hypothetical protein ABSE87_16415 [Terracidiphilus sp.]|jgi:hypothetical protein
MAWTTKISGAETLEPAMIAAFEEGTQAGLEALGIKGAEMVQEYIITPYGALPPAVAFGNLAASITPTFVREASMCTEFIGVSPAVGADVYAAPVETGSKPHMPPASALVPWVQKKFGIDDEKKALSLAFAISMSMKKKGTQGHEMFSRALVDLEPLAPAALEHAIGVAFTAHGFTGATA